ncbi:hypothetical protein GCM10007874_56560 [Labrys miyagiensis]|uniref:2'-5' RNA ligase family protein n=1 Tax=Labrys miyagiensis TaxID=346912 RepID=A0ABQ6CQK1_9HYPH|nr:2'-5' RNA ligase family protein [Labrys miyagiensis]GLS22636.1 hypothetical protein GCM10007874_56560 [Labrys miyagiensis]
MSLAVTLRLDAAAAGPVERIWHGLAEQLGVREVLDLGYHPHITLAVIEAAALPAVVEEAVFAVADGVPPLPVNLAGFGIFPDPPPTVWLAPAVTSELLALHERVTMALRPIPIRPHDLPRAWVPHVTLSQSDRHPPARILEIAMALWGGPIRGDTGRIELVAFPPAVIRRSQALIAPD